MAVKPTETIYAALVGGQVDVWRPVEAIPEGRATYRLPPNQQPDQAWVFPAGTVVRCERGSLDGGHVLAATAIAD